MSRCLRNVPEHPSFSFEPAPASPLTARASVSQAVDCRKIRSEAPGVVRKVLKSSSQADHSNSIDVVSLANADEIPCNRGSWAEHACLFVYGYTARQGCRERLIGTTLESIFQVALRKTVHPFCPQCPRCRFEQIPEQSLKGAEGDHG